VVLFSNHPELAVMIVCSRAALRTFRSLLRRSVLAEAPRGPWPPVRATAGPEGLVLRAVRGEVGLTLQLPNPLGHVGRLAFPGTLLARLEGNSDAAIELTAATLRQGTARWQERGAPHVESFTPLDPDQVAPLPDQSPRLVSMPEGFLQALDEASRTAARKPVRFAWQRVQLRGRAGDLVATDGRLLLIQGGFRFPFAEDLLVPALPVFGAKELAGTEPVQLGRAGDRIVVRAGTWTFDLALDQAGRFPDVQRALPRGQAPTQLRVDDADASYLVDVLPGLPAADEALSPVTLDLGDRVAVRAVTDKQCIELRLERSHVTGPSLRLALDRKPFYRLLRLGFRTFAFHAADQPVVARNGSRLAVLATLDASSIVAPRPGAQRLATTGAPDDAKDPLPERKSPMTTPSNGRPPEPAEVPDPLVEAEAVKTALHEALTRLTRLAGALRHFKKQQRTVQSVMASLRQLHPSP
jgi:hypothetical protein